MAAAGCAARQVVVADVRLVGSGRAELGSGALAGVGGNVGVNVAAGAGNAQVSGFVVH